MWSTLQAGSFQIGPLRTPARHRGGVRKVTSAHVRSCELCMCGSPRMRCACCVVFCCRVGMLDPLMPR